MRQRDTAPSQTRFATNPGCDNQVPNMSSWKSSSALRNVHCHQVNVSRWRITGNTCTEAAVELEPKQMSYEGAATNALHIPVLCSHCYEALLSRPLVSGESRKRSYHSQRPADKRRQWHVLCETQGEVRKSKVLVRSQGFLSRPPDYFDPMGDQDPEPMGSNYPDGWSKKPMAIYEDFWFWRSATPDSNSHEVKLFLQLVRSGRGTDCHPPSRRRHR